MSRSQSKLIAHFMILIMLVGIWTPFAASAMMTNNHQPEPMLSAGNSVVSPVASLPASNEKLTLGSEPACNACDSDMSEHDQNCTDSCCQSCASCSGVATFIKVPVFPAQYSSIKPIQPVATNLSVNLQLLERPPRYI